MLTYLVYAIVQTAAGCAETREKKKDTVVDCCFGRCDCCCAVATNVVVVVIGVGVIGAADAIAVEERGKRDGD